MARAVFFDVGNTLLRPHPSVSEVCRQIFSASGYEREITDIDRLMPLVDVYYEEVYRADDSFWTDDERTRKVWVGMYSLLCRELGIDEDAEALAMRVYDEFGCPGRWSPYDDVRPALTRLKERGLALGVISNWDRRLEHILEGLGIAEMFDTIISSAVVGMHKPDRRIFEYACHQVGVEPAEAVHVGDHHYADVHGAQLAGMRPVLIDRVGAHDPSIVLTTLDRLEAELGWVT